MKRYMVIERFKDDGLDAVYARFRTEGRMLPDGLHYVDSWLSREAGVCFQLMETDRPGLFQVWFDRWRDLVAFELFELD